MAKATSASSAASRSSRTNNPKKKRRGQRPIPLAPFINPAAPMRSRKRARRVTTLFHKLTRERDLALQKGGMPDEQVLHAVELRLEEMGGREEYQRASQLSTSFHSTSKWVLGQLANRGWLYGIVVAERRPDHDDNGGTKADDEDGAADAVTTGDAKGGGVLSSVTTTTPQRKRNKCSRRKATRRRTTRILEVGAINTELLDAAAAQSQPSDKGAADDDDDVGKTKQYYNIHVRAIDIHSMVKDRIEEADFLQIPFLDPDPAERYDVVVCSMVLNCVTTAPDRGKMLALLYHHLRPGGLCFFTLPKSCLNKSAFLTFQLFVSLLGETGVGFDVVATKDSPRVSFFVLQRPTTGVRGELDPKWTKQVVRNKGKKFPNQFSVVLKKEDVLGEYE